MQIERMLLSGSIVFVLFILISPRYTCRILLYLLKWLNKVDMLLLGRDVWKGRINLQLEEWRLTQYNGNWGQWRWGAFIMLFVLISALIRL